MTLSDHPILYLIPETETTFKDSDIKGEWIEEKIIIGYRIGNQFGRAIPLFQFIIPNVNNAIGYFRMWFHCTPEVIVIDKVPFKEHLCKSCKDKKDKIQEN